MSGTERLGFVTCRSGVLVVIDTGYLGIWSHDLAPILPEGSLDTAVDLEIVGADAEEAGRMLGMSWHPLYVYDQPPPFTELEEKLHKITTTHKLDARFQVITPRIPHRRRVDLALQQGSGAGEILFHGVWACAVADVPTSIPLSVIGARCLAPENDRWERVSIECRPQMAVARSEKIGWVGVDYARLLIADVDVLRQWKHDECLDGLADFVFWGADAEQAASALDAPRLESDEFGWRDVPEDVAQKRGQLVEEYRDNRALKVATDYRPHSHHWRVMGPTRKSPTESGMTEIDGLTVCNFMTTWGDGVFDVYRDMDAAGRLVRIRIEFKSIE